MTKQHIKTLTSVSHSGFGFVLGGYPEKGVLYGVTPTWASRLVLISGVKGLACP